jgi:hypothetical protein
MSQNPKMVIQDRIMSFKLLLQKSPASSNKRAAPRRSCAGGRQPGHGQLERSRLARRGHGAALCGRGARRRPVPNTGVKVLLDTGPLLNLDGQRGYGQITGVQAMQMGIERAKQHGVCTVALSRSHHLGRIGHFAEMAVAQGLVSVHFVNVLSRPVVAPFGGGDGRFGTNPCCIGVPMGKPRALCAGLCHQPRGARQDARGPQQGRASATRLFD